MLDLIRHHFNIISSSENLFSYSQFSKMAVNNTLKVEGSVPLFIDFRDTHASEAILPRFLLQVMIILVLCRVFGKILGYLRQPPVIGEMIAGIFVGPSILGYANGWTSTFYPPESVSHFALVANIGLILFMFYMGLELDETLLRKQWKYSFPIAVSAILFPFGVGALFSLWLYELNNASFVEPVDRVSFTLFSGSSMSFTAFPVLASILTATRLVTAPIGVQALSCAAIDDILAWTLLAISSSFAKQGDAKAGLYTLLLATGFVILWIFPVRMILAKIHLHYLKINDEHNKGFTVIIIFQLLVAAFIAEEIGIHSFFGAFVAGLVVPKSGQLVQELAPKVELMTVEFFLPLYFANSGIKTQIGTLNDGESWAAVFAVIATATFAKFTPACLVSKLVTRRDWKFCITVGVLMNTRGLVELIALNVGLEAKILSPRLFTILVMMALATTFMTSPLMYFLYQRTYDPELEEHRARALTEVKQTPDAVLDQLEADENVYNPDLHQSPRGPTSPYRLHVDTSSRISAENTLSSFVPRPASPNGFSLVAESNLTAASVQATDSQAPSSLPRQGPGSPNLPSRLKNFTSIRKSKTSNSGDNPDDPISSDDSVNLSQNAERRSIGELNDGIVEGVELTYQSPSRRGQGLASRCVTKSNLNCNPSVKENPE